MKKTTVVLRVTLDLPEEANVNDAMAYVRDAVKSHRGGIDPDLPMSDLNRESVKVSLQSKHTEY